MKKRAISAVTISAAAIAGLLSVGCDTEKTSCRDVIGKFAANRGAFRDIIEIRSDGTYVHTYHMYPQQPELVSTNTWTCESAGGETRITFERFLWGLEFVQPNLTREQREMPGFWIVEAEKSAGRVRFRIHPDVNEYYVKE